MDCVVSLAPISRMTRRTNSGDGTARRRKEGAAPVSAAGVAHKAASPPSCVGVDLHRDAIRLAVAGREGNAASNTKAKSDRRPIKGACAGIPKGARYVVESPSAWYGACMPMTAELGLGVVVADPRQIRPVAPSKKKTDGNDAAMPGRLPRPGHIPAVCVPSREAAKNRRLVGRRHALGQRRPHFKSRIRWMLREDRDFSDTPPPPPTPGKSGCRTWRLALQSCGKSLRESLGHVDADRCQQRDKEGREGGPQGPSLERTHVRPLALKRWRPCGRAVPDRAAAPVFLV